MKSNEDIDVNEKLFEAMIKIAAEKVRKEEMDAFPSLEELNKMYPSSEALENRIQAIIGGEVETYKKKRTVQRLTKIAAGFGVLFVASATVLMSVEATRNFIINTFISPRDDHVVFDFVQDDANIDGIGFTIGYIPEGFGLVSSQTFHSFNTVIYENAYGDQIFVQQHIASLLAISLDNELREFTSVFLNSREVHLFEALDGDVPNAVMWQHGNDVFNIVSNIAIDELLLIAESVTTN